MVKKDKKITILGDIHQKYDELDKLNLHNDYVVQLGDLGFNYRYIYKNYDSDKFKVIRGNHDLVDKSLGDYDLGDYGSASLNGMDFFFVRGEWSIDINQRIQHELTTGQKCWWKEEELTAKQMEECLQLYQKIKPTVVLSHGCPASISELVGNPTVWKYFGWEEKHTSNTQLLLQAMIDCHAPELFVHGHYHVNKIHVVNGTTFICIDELNYLDFNENWEIV